MKLPAYSSFTYSVACGSHLLLTRDVTDGSAVGIVTPYLVLQLWSYALLIVQCAFGDQASGCHNNHHIISPIFYKKITYHHHHLLLAVKAHELLKRVLDCLVVHQNLKYMDKHTWYKVWFNCLITNIYQRSSKPVR